MAIRLLVFILFITFGIFTLFALLTRNASAQTFDCNPYYSMPNCWGNESICGGLYCTRIPQCGIFRCMPPKTDGETCLDNLECQPNYLTGGNRVCSATQCRAPGSPITAACCPVNTFWCPATNSCTGQDSSSCPCVVDESTPTATPTPAQENPNESSGSCPSSGVKEMNYDKTRCTYREARSAQVTCNDGTTTTLKSSFGCTDTFRFESQARTFCSSHKTCPEPSPSTTPTQDEFCSMNPNDQFCITPPTSQGLTCDPTGDGKIDVFDFNIWRDEYLTKVLTSKKSACFSENKTEVDIFDFNVWRDIAILNKRQPF